MDRGIAIRMSDGDIADERVLPQRTAGKKAQRDRGNCKETIIVKKGHLVKKPSLKFSIVCGGYVIWLVFPLFIADHRWFRAWREGLGRL